MFHIFVPMEDVLEFLSWAKIQRHALDSVINKVDEKIELDDDDYRFMEKIYMIFEEDAL